MSTFESAAETLLSPIHTECQRDVTTTNSSDSPDVELQTLHQHQKEGISWMLCRWRVHRNVIVADEMGLGKTLQTLAFLAHLMESEHITGPFLVVAPLSVAGQWVDQVKQFIPYLRTYQYMGSVDEREEMRRTLIEDHIMKLPPSVLASGDPQPLPFDIFVTNYETVLSDIDFVSNFKWRVIVYDEGHRLKNPEGVTHRLFVERLHADFQIILTGTPIQNNIQEFWSLLNFLHPEIFTDSTRIDSSSPLPAVLDRVIDGVLLRRLFANIPGLKLPEMDQLVIRTEMSPIQADLYRWALYHYAASLNSASSSLLSAPAGILSNLMMTLRKISSHPYLIPGVEPEPFAEGPHLWFNSNKLTVLKSLLSKMRAEKSRCLIFSGFTSLLDICQDFLDLEKIHYERLDGSVRREDRTEAISRFADGGINDGAEVFLLSTRAGGVGLNLTAANWVIFLDTDWNPQMDLQAMARVFRQGQQKEVKVFRLVTKGTVDELMFFRSVEKLKFAKKLLDKSEPVEPNTRIATFGASQLFAGVEGDMKRMGEMPTAPRLQADGGSGQRLDVDDLIESVEIERVESVEKNGVVVKEGYKKFEGVDYAVVKSPSEKEVADIAAMDALIKTAVATHPKQGVRLDGGGGAPSGGKARAQAMTAEIRQKLKEEKWQKLGYSSHVIPPAPANLTPAPAPSADSGSVIHTHGSFTQPQHPSSLPHASSVTSVIVHCVDNSGIWPTNSRLFMSLANAFPDIPKYYYKAKQASDLRYGEVHLVPTKTGGETLWVALCVCHRGEIDNDLKLCLLAIGSHYQGKAGVSFHFSRIGDTRGTLYLTERLITRYLCTFGFDAYIYYSKTTSAQPVDQPVAQPLAEPVGSPSPRPPSPAEVVRRKTLVDYFKKPVESVLTIPEKKKKGNLHIFFEQKIDSLLISAYCKSLAPMVEVTQATDPVSANLIVLSSVRKADEIKAELQRIADVFSPKKSLITTMPLSIKDITHQPPFIYAITTETLETFINSISLSRKY